jgi:hypothetical protein
MSEPLPPLPEPFAPAPRPLRGPGCGRGALVGCGVLMALFGIAMVGLTLNKDRLLAWVMHRLQVQVEAKLPADLTPAERQRLSAAFAELDRVASAGKVDPASAQALQRQLWTLANEVDRGLDREQVLRLTEAVEEAAGKPPGDAPEGGVGPPAPAASPAAN